jgi:outer membrane lipoprotein SlyB
MKCILKQRLIAAMLATSALAVTGACSSFGAQDYNYSEARSVQSVAYGTLESVRPVRLDEDHSLVGTGVGAVLGGLVGNTLGGGNGRAATTVLGAVGGGLAGNALEHNATQQEGAELVVRLDSGQTIAVVQDGSQRFEAGQRVRVLTGSHGARVEHA